MTAPGAHARVPLDLWDDLTWLDACLASRGLWSTALTWSADQLTDGVVSTARLRRLGASDSDIETAVADGLFIETDGELVVWRFGEICRSKSEVIGERDAKAERLSERGRKGANARWNKDPQPEGGADAAPCDAMLADACGCLPMLGDACRCDAMLGMPTKPKPKPKPKNASSIDPGIPRDAGEVLEAKKNHDPSELDRPPTFPELPWPAEAITTAEMMLADPDGRPAPSDGFLTPEDLLAGQWARWVAEQTSRSRDGPKIPLTKAGWTARFVNDLAHIPRRTS